MRRCVIIREISFAVATSHEFKVKIYQYPQFSCVSAASAELICAQERMPRLPIFRVSQH
jgi:hypothetical protein